MKIIADTNIWYYISEDKALYEKVKGLPIAPTYVSIFEINTSKNVIDKEDLARGACRMQFQFKRVRFKSWGLIAFENSNAQALK